MTQTSLDNSQPLLDQLEPRLLLSGTAYIVDSLADVIANDGLITLREAIEAANSNTAVTGDVSPGSVIEPDTITFAPELASQSITLNGTELQITDSLNITAPTQKITINANSLSRVMQVSGQTTEVNLEHLNITGGYVERDAGGIYNAGKLTLLNSTVSNNSIDYSRGGAIVNDGGSLTIVNSTVSDNTAAYGLGGAIVNDDGLLTIVNSTISDNTTLSGSGGGVLNLSGTAIFVQCTFSGNTSSRGGALRNHASATLTDCTIVNNDSSGYGGGIESTGQLTISNSTISGNSAKRGGGIHNFEGTLTLSNLTVTNNISQGSGGGIWSVGEMTLADSTVSGNVSNDHDSRGGGIFNFGPATITNTIVSDNTAGKNGGGISTDGDEVIIENSTITNNLISRDPGYGGGIHNYGTLIMTDSTVSYNSAESRGGGINNDGNGVITIISSVIVNNESTNSMGSGGGISNSGQMNLINSIIAGNVAHRGGGIGFGVGTLKLTNSTVTGNTANDNGGGISSISSYNPTLTLNNSIVTLNNAPNNANLNINGYFTSNNSLLEAGPSFVQNPTPGEDGQWGTADDDIGDLHLADNSIAINMGDPNLALDHQDIPLTTDLDGKTRTRHAQVDIGAYEYQDMITPLRESPSSTVTTLMDVTDAHDGVISLREALIYADSLNEQNINFAQELSGGTILLNGHQLIISQSLTIDTTPISWITIDADHLSRIFFITGQDTHVSLAGLFLTGGHTTNGGGAIYNNHTSLTITSSYITANAVTDDIALGGAIYTNGDLTMSNVTVTANTVTGNGADGGGIYSKDSILTVNNCIISNNQAISPYSIGGGLCDENGILNISNSTISDNSAGSGGGIFSSGTLTLNNSTVQGNTTSSGTYNHLGGGLNISGDATIINSTITQNSARQGGGIYNSSQSPTSLINSTLSGNHAEEGGAIFNRHKGDISLVNVEMVGNAADNNGGGIYNFFDSQLTITNSTIAGNVSKNYGGGIYNENDGLLTLTNTIIAINEAETYSDIRFQESITTNSSLLAIDPSFTRNPSPGNDLIWGTADDDYGDLRLRPNSIAINMGDTLLAIDHNSSPLITDINGQSRVTHGQVDIGANEYQATTLPQQHTPSNIVTTALDVVDTLDGEISIREAMFYNTILYKDILFSYQLNNQTISLNTNELFIYQSLTINAPSSGQLTIDAGGLSHTMIIAGNGGVTLANLAITGGYTTNDGGAIHYASSGTLTMINSTIYGNTAYNGGAIYIQNGIVNISNSVMSDNSADIYGGAIFNEYNNNLIVEDSLFENNRSEYGGAITNRGTLNLNNSTVQNNSAKYGGGICNLYKDGYSDSGMATLNHSTISDNSAYQGGGIDNRFEASLVINSTSVSNNSASYGGGIYDYYKGTIEINHSLVEGNTSTYDGGGILIANNGHLTLNNSMVTSNIAQKPDSYGGGIKYVSNNYDELILANTYILDNTADYGGGIYVAGKLNSSNSTISNNSAIYGGGIYLAGGKSSNLTHSIVSYNQATYGGGIYNRSKSAVTMINIKIWGNSASTGGGVYNNNEIEMTTINSTITANSAFIGPGIFNHSSSQLILTNTIVSLNDALTKQDIDGEFINDHSLVGIDPWFVRNPSAGSDGDWGTWDDDSGDLHLLSGSKAIDAGIYNEMIPVADWDHHQRYNDPYIDDIGNGLITYVDIGAYEAHYAIPVPNGDFTGDHVTGIFDLDILGKYWGLASNATKSQGDANGDGKVSLLDLDILGQTWGMSTMLLQESTATTPNPYHTINTTSPTSPITTFHTLDTLLVDDDETAPLQLC